MSKNRNGKTKTRADWCKGKRLVQAWIEPVLHRAVGKLIKSKGISIADMIEGKLYNAVRDEGFAYDYTDEQLLKPKRGRNKATAA